MKFLFKIKSQANDPADISFYKKYKKIYKKVIVSAKKLHNDLIYSQATNKSKTVWSIINNNLDIKETKSGIENIKIGDNLINDPYIIAQHLNKYFIDLPVKLNNELNENLERNNFMPVQEYPTLFLEPVTKSEIFNIIMNLKSGTSSGIDNLSSNLIKKSVDFIVAPLTFLINLSLSEGHFPSILKTAKVFPLFKKGDNTLPENYRPVATLSTISKILERVVFNRIVSFTIKYNILSESQHGFRKSRSTETAIMAFLNKLYNHLDKNDKCVGIFMDLSKAFDLINHKLLIEKLAKYGLRGKVNDWLVSYLSNRMQLVEVNRVKSDTLKLNIGVPQGSVLGPLLFLFYVNDLPNFFEDFLIMFADDNSYLCCKNTFLEVINSARTNITKFSNYFKADKLFLNISKTVFIIFSPRTSTYNESHLVKINGKSIEQVSSTKFLGVYIDNALTWEVHIDSTAKKLASVCYAIYRLTQIANKPTVMSYYYAHFVSRVSYGIMFWGCSHHSERIFRLQKKAVRYIAGVSKYSSCRNIFKDLNVLTLACIYILEIVLYVKTNLNIFPTNNFNHTYSTREKNYLNTPLHKLSKFEESPNYMGIKLYNKTPNFIKNTSNIKLFKKEMTNYLCNMGFYSIEEFLNM